VLLEVPQVLANPMHQQYLGRQSVQWYLLLLLLLGNPEVQMDLQHLVVLAIHWHLEAPAVQLVLVIQDFHWVLDFQMAQMLLCIQ
jgi:hypothetical protein